MKIESIRVGDIVFDNKTKLNSYDGLDFIFGGFQKFVHILDFYPWDLVNGTWTGAFGYMMNDMQIDWKLCI
jgi:hypothetical protein